ncbi:hypothetical protein A2U01_0067733, partial [Trifolium medium]|nr:hypothetical protein [Trifolium medium]
MTALSLVDPQTKADTAAA